MRSTVGAVYDRASFPRSRQKLIKWQPTFRQSLVEKHLEYDIRCRGDGGAYDQITPPPAAFENTRRKENQRHGREDISECLKQDDVREEETCREEKPTPVKFTHGGLLVRAADNNPCC